MSNLKKKPIFIHIPKAGGTSIRSIVLNHNNELPNCLHLCVTDYAKTQRDSSYVFTFTRNPYDRLLSAYMYLTQCSSDEFIHDYAFGQSLIKNFKEFVKHDLQYNLNWLHFRPMVTFLDDDIDFVGRFETYQRDFDFVCENTTIEKQKIPHKNKSNHSNYKDYYDEETSKIVSKIYQDDLKCFNYTFD